MAGIKGTLAVIMAAALAVAAALPAYADEARTSTRTITYSAAAEDPSRVPSSFEDGDGTWALSRTSVASQPKMEHARVEHVETTQCLPEELAAAEASFPGEIEVEDGGQKATVKLTGVQAVPVFQDVEVACNEVVTYAGLPSNDMVQIPGFWTGQVGGVPGDVTLELAGCSWEVSALDEFGMPAAYQATALYRGMATFEDIHHYDLTAAYEWEGERPVAGGLADFAVTAVYELEPAPAAAAVPEEAPLWLPFAIAATVAVGGFGFAVAFWRRRNVTYYRGEEGSFEKVARGRAKRLASGNLALDFPAQFDLTKNPYKIELRRDIAGCAKIIVLQRGVPVYEGRAWEVIDIEMAA